MIRENQKLLNRLNVLSDGVILFACLPLAFWLRFFVLPDGIISVPLEEYLVLSLILAAAHVIIFGAMGMYSSHRRSRLKHELARLIGASALVLVGLLSVLFVRRDIDYSRVTLAIYFVLAVGVLGAKRIALRLTLRSLRRQGYNSKHVLLVGGGKLAENYLRAIRAERELGYNALGYLAATDTGLANVPYLGGYARLEKYLESRTPDEVIAALDAADVDRLPEVIAACEKTGTKLAIIPLYAEYMSANPQFDELGGIPLMNIRRIPLDNWGSAFVKRFGDILCSALLLILTSPIMLACAIGVKLSSPGPVIFSQQRVGRGKREFKMYKFRSMRLNDESDSAWSEAHDARKTKFGAFMRKFSLDEFPQFFNVLKGDMSLVGPRPEIPFHVDRFKEDVPLYMVKHQVRPGITGWAQVNGYRGDTSIKGRIEHDIYYIEHWTPWFDVKILLRTVFGAFVNEEKLD